MILISYDGSSSILAVSAGVARERYLLEVMGDAHEQLNTKRREWIHIIGFADDLIIKREVQ